MAQSTVLSGATVYDGTGSAGQPLDLLITGDRIAAISPPGRFRGMTHSARTIDVTRLSIAPGFIDVHSHSDSSPLIDLDDTSKILQGVTTEVNGNCGFGLAPINPAFVDDFTTLAQRIFPPLDFDWQSLDELHERAAATGFITNFAFLAGHNTLRVAAMGSDERAPTPAEMTVMKDQLYRALESGAAGLTTGLIYPPGIFSTTEEITELASIMPATAVYASHMRNESSRVRESIEETVNVASHAGVRCHVSHLKVAGRCLWGQMGEIIETLDSHRTAGLSVTHDVYPYTASSTMLTAVLPPWAHDGGAPALLQRLASPSERARMAQDIAEPSGSFESHVRSTGWENIVIASTASHRYEGLSLAALGAQQDRHPLDAVAELLIDEQLKATMIIHGIGEEDVQTALRSPYTAIGSDGLPVGTGGKPHPRGYGTFARMLDVYVRREKLMRIEEAIRRMTSLAADIFSLPERGRIAAGSSADLVIFDAEGLNDHATFDDPMRSPSGIHAVWVGGEQVVKDGAYLGRRNGTLLSARH